jgi:5-methylcytosine-specific restriction endonuclease McrA
MGYRDYYDKDLDFLIREENKHLPLYTATKRAKARHRMYANLFCREMKRKLINSQSKCALCGSRNSLVADHITPISKGGKNTDLNIQILCAKCNILKSNKIT